MKTANRTMIGGALLCVLVLRCAFAFAGPVLDVAPQSAGDQADFETGMRAAADGNLLRAQTIFETLRRIEPHAPQAYIGLAEVATRAGRLSEADKWLSKGLWAKPDDIDLMRARAHLAALQKHFADAIALLTKASARDPGNGQIQAELVRLYAGPLDDPGHALIHYEAALATAPADAGLGYDYAFALAKAGRAKEAVAALAAVQKIAPKNPLPSFVAARLYAENGRNKEALAMLDAALRIEPGLKAAQLVRGEILARAGQYEQAARIYRQMLRLDPASVPALVGLGMAYQGLGRDDAASDAFQAVVARDADNIFALNNLAWISASRRQNLDQAEIWIKHALKQGRDDPALRDTLGWVYRQKGELPLAEAALHQGLSLHPSASLYYHLGLVASDEGRSIAAQRLFENALRLEPWRADALAALWDLANKASPDGAAEAAAGAKNLAAMAMGKDL